jgi:hypothetical protein
MTILCSPKVTQHHCRVNGACRRITPFLPAGKTRADRPREDSRSLAVFIGARISFHKLSTLRACGADDGTAKRTPAAWMISLASLSCPRANRVLRVGHPNRAQIGHSCRAPKRRERRHPICFGLTVRLRTGPNLGSPVSGRCPKNHIGILPETACRKNRGSPMLKPAIDGPPSNLVGPIVVKIVDVGTSRGQRVGSSENAKLLKRQGKHHGVSTGDPHCPRGGKEAAKAACFQLLAE